MAWILGGVVLLAMAMFMRQLLGLNVKTPSRRQFLDTFRQRFCEALALDLESQAAILAVSLNDAIEELISGNPENAWKLLHLAAAEWNRLSEILSLLLRVMTTYLPLARVAPPVRIVVSEYFKSDAMMEYIRLHNWVDQFLFRAKFRFSLQVRILRHGVDSLTTDFRKVQPHACLSLHPSPELWRQLDSDFHDFDLITKETLLAVRSFVMWLSESAVREFAAELRPVLERAAPGAPPIIPSTPSVVAALRSRR